MKFSKKTTINDSVRIQKVNIYAYTIPTDFPESDGTIEWDSTTLILVEIIAGNKTGIGYTYSNEATGYVIEHSLKKYVVDEDVFHDGQQPSLKVRTRYEFVNIANSAKCGFLV
mgnify:CR=1 FL=1